MADLKISQLTAYTTPVTADVFPIVENSGPTTKKITFGDTRKGIRNETITTYTDTFNVPVTDDLCICNKATAMTANLPAATGTGKTFNISNIGAGAVLIQASGLETIDGENTQTIYQFESLTITDYGSGTWKII